MTLPAIDRRTLRLLPESAARQWGVIPLREVGDQLILASSSPIDGATERAIAAFSGRSVGLEPASASSIREATDAYYPTRRPLPMAPAGSRESPHVLVTDDTPIIRVIARALLTKAGMRVTEAEDGKSALEQLSTGAVIDLVLLDLDMPVLGGLETLQRIRGDQATAHLPVLILTGSDEDVDRVVAIDAGADDYVTKPIVADRLLTRVRAALRRRSSG